MWHTLWVFFTQNGVGQNLTASALLGAPAFLHLRSLLKRHHRERLAQAERMHAENKTAISKVRLAAMRASVSKRTQDYRDSGPV